LSDWRPSVLAAAVVLLVGGYVGAVTAPDSRPAARTVTERVIGGAGQQPATASDPTRSATTTTSADDELTPPARPDAPDTLSELYRAGRLDDDFGGIDVGTKTIAGKTYDDGVSMFTDRSGDDFSNNTGRLPITLKRQYLRLRGVVGIDGEAPCPGNDASVSIVDDQGQILWGPRHVSFNVDEHFDIAIKDLPRIELVQRSLASSEDRCDDGEVSELTYPAWGQLKFVK